MNPLLKTPSTDFNAVRDGRNSLPLYLDIDLSAARDKSANTQLVIGIAGNSFYADADTTNGGNAVVTFQDTNLGESGAPFFISPGFIANVGFTQLLVENTAQAGKRLRIFYGVDIDFQAGVNSSIAISGSVLVSGGSIITEVFQPVSYYDSVTPLPALNAATVFTAAANTNGAIIHSASFINGNNVGFSPSAFIVRATAPLSLSDGDVILGIDNGPGIHSPYVYFSGSLKNPVKIPSGLGLFFIDTLAQSVCHRACSYTLL